MRYLLSLALLLASTVHADMWTLYDGDGTITQPHNGVVINVPSQAGVSCGHYNAMLSIPWRHKGGDWVDAAGTPQGNVPFALGAVADVIKPTAPAQVEIDVTSLIGAEGIMLRLPAARQTVVRIGMREHATYYPTLEAVTPDGVVMVPITADASLQFVGANSCSVSANQKSPTGTISPTVVMGLQWPAGTTSARLHLWVLESSSGSTSIEAYRMVIPRIETSQANAVPVSATPGIIWQQNFDADCPKYWEGLGYTITPNAQWTTDTCPGERYGFGSRPGQSGIYRANGQGDILAQGTTDMMVPRGTGWNGTNGLGVIHHPDKLAQGVEMPNVKLSALNGGELEEAWFRMMVKFGPTFHGTIDGSGGKMPGFKNVIDYCAGSGIKANGYCGWTLRNGFRVGADPQNPGHGHVRIDTYAYHAEQTDYTGASWAGDYRALVPLEKWACVEQRVRVNDPGVKNGINQIYIDGVLVLDRQDVYLRGPRPSTMTGNPAHGYGDWWLAGAGFPSEPAGAPRIVDPVTGRTLFWRGGPNLNSNLAIDGLYWVQHGGGGKPIGKPGMQQWFDEFVISRERAGCPDTPPPPPVEVCGNGLDDDGDGLIDEGCAPPPVEVCGNGLDDNGDGQVDEGCPPPPEEICGDGIDNDGDGVVDNGCAPPPTELEILRGELERSLAELGEAHARIQALEVMATASAAQIEELRALANAAEARAAAARATINAIRQLTEPTQ